MLRIPHCLSGLARFPSHHSAFVSRFQKWRGHLGGMLVLLILVVGLPGTPSLAQDPKTADVETADVSSAGVDPAVAEPSEKEKPAQPLNSGKTMCTIPIEGETSFSFFHPGNVYLGIRFTMKPENVVSAEVSGHFSGPDFEFNPVVSRHLEGTAGPSSLFDSIPVCPGTFTLKLNNGTETIAEVGIELVDLGPVPAVFPASEMGAIIVKKGAEAQLTFHPDLPSEVQGALWHKRFSPDTRNYDITPTGDVTTSLPAGLYKVVGGTKELGIGMETHLVPVYAGRTTIVENWPTLDEKPLKEIQGASGLKIRQVATEGSDVRVRFSTPDWKGSIATSELEIYEGGMPGEVLSIRRSDGPLHLIILLDSSGSMKNDMKKVLEAASAFILGLDKSSTIELIDFDTQPKPLKTKTREDAVKALKGIKADGATALNDTIIKGVTQAKGADRIAVVLFTDGFDANHNDTGPGSKATPEEMLKTVQEGGVPVFTIGYGKKPDEPTLKRLASLSGGAYFRAQSDTIGKVFEQLKGILGRDFEMVYRRPGITAPSDVPVVCIVQDRSGSMNMPPDEEKTCGYRMEEAKDILRGFVRGLPDNALVQIMDFHMYVTIQQLWTSNRTEMLRGISQIFSGGGTDIVSALDAACRSLRQIPSRRQYLLFVTDLALPALDDTDFLEQIGRLKDAGIHCTWVGMVNASERGPFEAVASMTGGFAAVADDASSLRQAVDRLGRQISGEKASDNRLEVRLVVGKKDDAGEPLVMGAADLFPLPPSPRTATASVNGVRYRIIDHDAGTIPVGSTTVVMTSIASGSAPTPAGSVSDILAAGTIGAWKIERRMPLTGSAGNKALTISPRELIFIDAIHGLESPEGERLVALHLAFSRTGSNAAGTCQVPNLRRQMFLNWNDTAEIPISPLTWVSDSPLMQPGDDGLTIPDGAAVEGYVVFRVPREGLTQGWLTFYDEKDGHVKVPLVGDQGAPLSLPGVASAPRTPEGAISPSVSVRVLGYEERPTWQVDDAEGHIARVYEVELSGTEEEVFACDPYKQVRLCFHSQSGFLGIAPSLLTSRMPFGWQDNLRLAPGAPRVCRLVFVLPEKLAALGKGSLAIIHASGVTRLDLDEPKIGSATKTLVEAKKDGMVVQIHRLVAPEPEGRLGVDVTFCDEKDGKPSRLEPVFKLQEGENEPVLPTESPEQYLLAFPPVIELADGEDRRGFIFFEQFNDQGFLVSEPLGIRLPARPEKLGEAELYLAERMRPLTYQADPPEWMEPVLQKAARDLLKTREAKGWKKPGSVQGK